ncbi:LAQU0S02e01640g1_1 [Lachancea quebecensis]|uniref:LAQU0S02e01640g1_1 n=1 Tax=Lachancea quebecensis TaxID=1654605 RepID=A0A0P1KXU2_9SACH|nr:LAQU0S02e01640g1_1 [Lachancea quebecensis]
MAEHEGRDQDINLLNDEILQLREKCRVLEHELQAQKKDVDNVPVEFEGIFQRNPELKRVLSQKLLKETHSLPRTPHSSPTKRQPMSLAAQPSNLSPDIPESEWVLKTQRTVEHKFFDSAIADLIETDILTSPSKRKQAAQFRAHEELVHKVQIENIYRMLGISAFPVVDPSDLEGTEDDGINIKRKMLGLRLEVFSELDCSFESPYYILFKQNPKNGYWSIFRHTVPSYVGLEQMFEQMKSNGLLANQSEIYTFAKKVYKSLLKISVKTQTFRSMEKKETISHLEIDPSCTSVSFRTERLRCLVKLKLDATDVIACSCTPHVNINWNARLLGPVLSLPDRMESLVK